MAKLPTDLTDAGWQKLKAKTVGKTGFGAKLDAYAIAKAALSDLQKRNMKAYTDAATALHGITDAIPAAVKKCNKTLHKDTIAALEGYKGLVAKEGTELLKEQQQYHGYVDDWVHRRQVSFKELGIIHKAIEDEEKDAAKVIGDHVKSNDRPAAIKVAEDAVKKLQAMQKQADESCATWRVPKVGKEQPHVDDRPDTLFAPLIKLTNEIDATRHNAEQKFETLKKKLQG